MAPSPAHLARQLRRSSAGPEIGSVAARGWQGGGCPPLGCASSSFLWAALGRVGRFSPITCKRPLTEGLLKASQKGAYRPTATASASLLPTRRPPLQRHLTSRRRCCRHHGRGDRESVHRGELERAQRQHQRAAAQRPAEGLRSGRHLCMESVERSAVLMPAAPQSLSTRACAAGTPDLPTQPPRLQHRTLKEDIQAVASPATTTVSSSGPGSNSSGARRLPATSGSAAARRAGPTGLRRWGARGGGDRNRLGHASCSLGAGTRGRLVQASSGADASSAAPTPAGLLLQHER